MIVSRIQRLTSLFATTNDDDPELAAAQFLAYRRQVPVIYIAVLSAALSSIYVFHGKAPLFLSTIFPACLTIIACLRLLSVWRGPAPTLCAVSQGHMRMARSLAVTIGTAFCAWLGALFVYSDSNADMRAFTLFLVGIIGQNAVLSIMYLRKAAQFLTLLVAPSVGLFLVLTGGPIYAIIGAMFICGSLLMAYMIAQHAGIFASMVAAHAEARRLSTENFQLANLDVLTGLPNRRAFFTHAADVLRNAAQDGAVCDKIMLATMDLNGFKPINDLYGHPAGDQLLVETAARLRRFASEQTFVARLGGDEFAFLHKGSADVALALAKQIAAVLRAPFVLDETEVKISTSIGLAGFPEDGLKVEELFERADFALYRSKEQRGAPVLFDAQLRAAMERHIKIEQALRAADLQAEFFLEFQPMYCAKSGAIVGFEALARWNAPGLGRVGPDIFIPLAERSGLIHKLSRTLLAKAVTEANLWPEHIRLSFNLSIRDVLAQGAALTLTSILSAGRFDPRRLDIELTETELVRNFEKARETILAFKSIGTSIALDDFGTGYSSLSYVQRLPFDKIKIDRSFIRDLDDDESARNIVRTLLDLCGHMRLDCVAEGVETAAHAAILRELGCPVLQGYHFSRPLGAEQARALANAESSPVAQAG